MSSPAAQQVRRWREGHLTAECISDQRLLQCLTCSLPLELTAEDPTHTEPLREDFCSLSVSHGDTEALGAVAPEGHLPLALRIKSENLQQVGQSRWLSR